MQTRLQQTARITHFVIRLVLVIPTLDRSGAEKQFALLATQLPRDEFDIHAVAMTRGGPYEAPLRESGIPLTILGKRWKCDPFALWKLKRLLARDDPDILHTWLFTANAYGRLLAGKASRPQVVVSERCVDSWKSSWQLRLDRRQAKRTRSLIANSQGVADFYSQQGFPPERIVVIPNGVKVADEEPPDREAVLREYDVPPEGRVIGYVGRLARQKRVSDLFYSFHLLRQLTDSVYLLIVGDGPERARLEELAQQMRIDHLVRFAGQRDDATRLIRLMNVFWLASDFEGMSNSLMEAMAAGVPAVVSKIGPNRELVIDGKTGFLVDVGDHVGFAQFTDRLLADPQLAGRLGGAARERALTEFSIKTMVNAHADLYREIVAAQQ
jgi:glycosyltransferase involved in cell wall biosynthesis